VHLEEAQHLFRLLGSGAQGDSGRSRPEFGIAATADRPLYRDNRAEVVTTMASNRVLIVANRLPVMACVGSNGIEMLPSAGGVASGLRSWHQRSKGLWFGWPGPSSDMTPTDRGLVDEQLGAGGLVPLHLSSSQIDGYYHGFANRVLWPLCHYSIDRVPLDALGWDAYREVNEAFANQVAHEYRSGDTIWVHDYHLMLLPALLRERLPSARIGYFLHIPFPSSEVFRLLPRGQELLDGVLGADLVGFHTFGYMRHFLTSLLHINGLESDVDGVRVGEREVRVAVFPMGIDAAQFATLAADPHVRARADAIRKEAAGRRIILGVDRLDYTKGLLRKLEAVAQLLKREKVFGDEIRYLQIAVPSRGPIDSYQRFRRDVEETVGRINGACGSLQSVPVHYIHQAVSLHELVALYCAADVMLVTPLRDGMNLVAKEFAAARIDEDGVLVLSEFAGAASELQGAVTVNPYDVHALADSIQRGLSMPIDERRPRMRTLRRRVCEHDVFGWADGFVHYLHSLRPAKPAAVCRPPEPSLKVAFADMGRTKRIRLLLDYDGTLVPLARSPEGATPDQELLLLLQRLASSANLQVDVVSGRPRDALERWFGHLSLSLWAEHGFWRRPRPGGAWEPAAPVASTWVTRLRPILDQFAASTPGARLEVKTASLAWHYRGAARDFGIRQARELRLLLRDLLSNQPVDVLEGKKVIEIRLRGIGKDMVARRVCAEVGSDVAILAFGDDRTDEELFRALPVDAVSVVVGRPSSAARFRVEDYRAVRRLLSLLIQDRDSVEHSHIFETLSA
jgi:trehalose 6-phosphate synthase/phosphatase